MPYSFLPRSNHAAPPAASPGDAPACAECVRTDIDAPEGPTDAGPLHIAVSLGVRGSGRPRLRQASREQVTLARQDLFDQALLDADGLQDEGR